jgi:hypothetical protein
MDMSKEEVRYDNIQGRGMYAAQDIKQGDLLFELPFYEMITLEMTIEIPINKQILKLGLI